MHGAADLALVSCCGEGDNQQIWPSGATVEKVTMKQTLMHGWADLALGSQCGEGDQETLMHGWAGLALGARADLALKSQCGDGDRKKTLVHGLADLALRSDSSGQAV